MAKLGDILEKEKNRSETGMLRTIYLYQEGTFYRAYEWSAWLCVRYISQFKATRLATKDGIESSVFVGFPVSSLSKFIPENYSMRNEGDKCIVVDLPNNIFGDVFDIEQLREEFANWKDSVPQSAKKLSMRHELKDGVKAEQPRHLTDIMAQVLAFPIEQKSPMECMTFIATLKQQISEIL